MTFKIGTVTMGQSPRDDIIPEITELISGDIEIVQRGCLDGFTLKEVQRFEARKDADLLVTRMRDGTEVNIARSHILAILQELISNLNREGVSLITLLCSGEFPCIESEKPLLIPHKLRAGFLSSISITGTLGVMVPSPKQTASAVRTFQGLGFKTLATWASPYENVEGVREAAGKLRGQVELVLMNCFGYNLAMKNVVKEITERPVITVRSLLARALQELVH